MRCPRHSARVSTLYVGFRIVNGTNSPTDTLNYPVVSRWAKLWFMKSSMSGRPIITVLAYPNIAMRFQEELDNVVGRDRLLMFDDKRSLPDLVAFNKKVTRRACLLRRLLPSCTDNSDCTEKVAPGCSTDHIPCNKQG